MRFAFLKYSVQNRDRGREDTMNWVVQSIIVIFFVSIFALGILGQRRTKGTADYYIGGRSVNGFLIAFVYITSMVSAGAMVGWISQAWQWGIYFIYSANAVTVAAFLCWILLGRKLSALSKEQNYLTVPDFIEARYDSRTARMIASLIILVFSVPLLVSQFTAIGKLLQLSTGMSYSYAVIGFGLVVFLYVTFGGYLAVIYTDVLQGFFLLVGVLVLFVSVFRNMPEPLNVIYPKVFPAGWVSFPTEGSVTTPGFLIAFVLLSFFGAFGSPNCIRAFYSMRDGRAYRQGLSITMSIVVLLEIIIVMIGIYGKVFFPELDSADNIVYYLIETIRSPLAAGIALTAIAAAVMSTMDSLLIQCASAVENDIFTRTLHIRLSEKKRLTVARLTVAVIGFICVVWSLRPPEYLALLMYPSWGVLGLSFAWVFYLGLYWKRFNKAGAVTAMITSVVVFTVWNALGNPYGIYHVQMALAVSIPAALIATWLTPPTAEETLKKFFK